MTALGIAIVLLGIGVILAIIRKILRGEYDADLLYTSQGRRLVPPRSPARRRRP